MPPAYASPRRRAVPILAIRYKKSHSPIISATALEIHYVQYVNAITRLKHRSVIIFI